MSRFHRWVVTVILMLCLPLQGMAAIAVPIGMVQQVVDVTGMHDSGHHATDTMADHCAQHKQADAQPEKSTPTCDNCFICHLSVAQALMPAMSAIPSVPAGNIPGILTPDKITLLVFPFFRPPIAA